jgi:hypothetical protein
MATISSSKSVPDIFNHKVVIHTWANMANGDVGAPVALAQFADRTAQVTGTFGAGGTLRIEGSIDGVTYLPLNDPQGTALDIISEKMKSVLELVAYIRPRVTAGDANTALTVSLLLKGS